jgi:protein phosphatase
MHHPAHEDTLDIPVPAPAQAQDPGSSSASVRVEVAALSDTGKVRSNNEDHYLVGRFGRTLETLLTNLPEGEVPACSQDTGHAVVVADGMGGHAAGEVASRSAIRTLVDLVLHVPDWILRADGLMVEEAMQRARDRYHEINAVLSEQARFDPQLQGMGTTMTLAWNLGADLFIAHLGDSRAYLCRQGKLHQLTRDHTMARAMVEMGLLTRQQAATHRLRHVLTQSLGAGTKTPDPEVQHLQLADGDILLVCTDGLTEMVPEGQIAEVLGREENADGACRQLVQLALEAGGKDNVTAVVARYRVAAAE